MHRYGYEPVSNGEDVSDNYGASDDDNMMSKSEETEAMMNGVVEDDTEDDKQEDEADINIEKEEGSIHFRGVTRETKAEFIVLEADTPASAVWSQMKNKWKINNPSLTISVIGGARPFPLNPKIESSFKAAILKLSQIPHAWIVSGGAYSGVMKLVGEALEETYSKVCLGISTWNDVADKSCILCEEEKPYVVGSWLANRGLFLDYQHTNFLIVKEDPGSQNAQNKFRADLEWYLKSRNSNLPAILLVVNGGFGTLQYVCEYVTKVGSPVVVVRHSGRCADLLAYGCECWEDISSEESYDKEHEKLFKKMIEYLIGEEDKYNDKNEMRQVDWEEVKLYLEGPSFHTDKSEQHYKAVEDLSTSYSILLDCLKKKELFSIAEIDSHNNIDTAILNGLLASSNDTFEKMKQTLLFNRADMARSYIFSEEPMVKDSELRELMIMALQRGDHAYVKLLMDYGANMHEILDASALELLYGYQLLEDNFLLDKFVEEYLENHLNMELDWEEDLLKFKNSPQQRKPLPRIVVIAMLNNLCHRFYDHKIYIFVETSDGKLDDPFWDLFMWAMICNMPNMADFLWPFGRNQIAKALIGAEVLQNMANIDTNFQQATDTLIECSKKYRLTAHEVLDELSAKSEDDTRKVTTAPIPKQVPTLTCLDMAVKIQDYEFVANSSIQMILWDVWTGPTRTRNVTLRDYLKFMVSIIFPFLMVSFGTQMAKGGTDEDHGDLDDEDGKLSRSAHARYANDPLWKKLYRFYFSTPIVTFLLHLWGSIIFLVLYSYLVMTGQCVRKEQSPLGILLCLYIVGYVVGEIYQICMYDAKKLSTKILSWISDTYNQFDIFNILLYFVAWSLSFYPATHGVSHTCHSVNCGLWILRFSTVIRIFPNLGLYLEMMTTMFIDLIWFLLILVVFILAFFVTSSSLLYPGNSASITHVHMFLRSWFSIYGEYFLEIKPDDNSTTTLTTPKINSYDEYVVWVIMGIYLLITNILLFNIIIAAFNTTYSNIQTNSKFISKYRIYDLVVEYSNRVSTPPPLSLVHHMWKLLEWIYRRVSDSSKCMHPAMKKLRYHPNDNERIRLRNFEHYYSLKVWKGKMKEEDASTEGSDQVFQNIEIQHPVHAVSVGDEIEALSERGEKITAAGFSGMSSFESAAQEELMNRMKTIEEMSYRIDAIGDQIKSMGDISIAADFSQRTTSSDEALQGVLDERFGAMEHRLFGMMEKMEEHMLTLGNRLDHMAKPEHEE